MTLQGAKVLVLGATGHVGLPIAKQLAGGNEVWAVARFSSESKRSELEAAGVRCVVGDLADPDASLLPPGIEYVLNFSVNQGGDFDHDLRINAESVGFVMHHYPEARAVLHCSTTGVYQHKGHEPLSEDDPLGDNHRVFLPTYSITKIAGEAVARTMARSLGVPTTIARLNVPYGDTWGWPSMHLDWMVQGTPIYVHSDAPSLYNPIHEQDLVRQTPKLLEVASVPATIVNWAGPEAASIEEWCAYMGEIVGVEPDLVHTDQTIASVTTDNTKMHRLIGEAEIRWRDGFRRLAETRYPDRVRV